MLDICAVITVRNGEPYIRRCLEHLIDQDIGVVVVDNDSTDRTRELAEGYVGRGESDAGGPDPDARA